MVNKLTLDQEKWIKSLSLKQNLQNTYSPMICLTLALSTLSDEVETGYFIGKQEFIIKSPLISKSHLTFKGEVKVRKHLNNVDYLVCDCRVLNGENALVEMSSTLIKSSNKSTKNANDAIENGEFFTRITKKHVHRFSELSKDPNNIHKSKSPVVQGMFILILIEDYLSLKNRFVKRGKINYFAPIVADCDLYFLFESDKILSGIVNNKVCFTLTIEEEFTC